MIKKDIILGTGKVEESSRKSISTGGVCKVARGRECTSTVVICVRAVEENVGESKDSESEGFDKFVLRPVLWIDIILASLSLSGNISLLSVWLIRIVRLLANVFFFFFYYDSGILVRVSFFIF